MKLSEQDRGRLRQVVKLCKWLFTPLALLFLLVSIWQARFIMQNAWENSKGAYFALAVLAWMGTHLLSPWFVSTALGASGATIHYRQALNLHLSYLPSRYMPGGIWHTVARVSGLYHLGVSTNQLSSFVILENLVALSVTLSIGGFLVGFYKHNSDWQLIAYFVATISLAMLLLCPILVNRFVLGSFNKVKFASYFKGILIIILFWSFASASFLLFVSSFLGNLVVPAWLQIIGVYLFSWGIGFLAIFAPQGVGVFEIVAASVMPISLPFNFNALVVLVAGFRLVVVFADLFMWVGWWLISVCLRLYRVKS